MADACSCRVVLNRHALRNVLIPVLTTLGTSLRFSLASLPVVEAFFNWPGVGLALLQAIESGLSPLVTDLIVSLGFLFLLINLALDVLYQVIDPRLRAEAQSQVQTEERRTWRERWEEFKSQIADRVPPSRKLPAFGKVRQSAIRNPPPHQDPGVGRGRGPGHVAEPVHARRICRARPGRQGRPVIPTFYVTGEIAQDLLAGTGTTLGTLKSRSTTMPLSTTVHMAATIEVHEVNARNVLGLLPGADPDHQDETVVLGANYDALGRDPDGTIYNGAYVNASGVAAMLEIARLWQAQGFRTVAMLNLNMVGRGEEMTIVGREAVADQFEASARVYSATVDFIPAVDWGDSLPFHEGAVPTAMLVCFETSQESVYHRPEDDVENIQLGSLRAAGVLAAHSLAAWSGGGPTVPLPAGGPQRTLRDLVLPTPTCPSPWPVGAMTCDHGNWSR